MPSDGVKDDRLELLSDESSRLNAGYIDNQLDVQDESLLDDFSDFNFSDVEEPVFDEEHLMSAALEYGLAQMTSCMYISDWKRFFSSQGEICIYFKRYHEALYCSLLVMRLFDKEVCEKSRIIQMISCYQLNYKAKALELRDVISSEVPTVSAPLREKFETTCDVMELFPAFMKMFKEIELARA